MDCSDWLDEGLNQQRDPVSDVNNGVFLQYQYETRFTKNTSFGVQTITNYLYKGGKSIHCYTCFMLSAVFISNISISVLVFVFVVHTYSLQGFTLTDLQNKTLRKSIRRKSTYEFRTLNEEANGNTTEI